MKWPRLHAHTWKERLQLSPYEGEKFLSLLEAGKFSEATCTWLQYSNFLSQLDFHSEFSMREGG